MMEFFTGLPLAVCPLPTAAVAAVLVVAVGDPRQHPMASLEKMEEEEAAAEILVGVGGMVATVALAISSSKF